MKKLMIVCFVFVSAALFAQGLLDLPKGRWWKNDKVVQDLGLSPDQQKALDGLMLSHEDKMIDLKAAMEKEELRMRDLLDRPALDERATLEQVDRTLATRTQLQRNRAVMFVKVRGILTPEQWAKARERLQERRQEFREERREFRQHRKEERMDRRQDAPEGPGMGRPEGPGGPPPDWN
jgi:Spy/CpxP family protein refolding chaperone